MLLAVMSLDLNKVNKIVTYLTKVFEVKLKCTMALPFVFHVGERQDTVILSFVFVRDGSS